VSLRAGAVPAHPVDVGRAALKAGTASFHPPATGGDETSNTSGIALLFVNPARQDGPPPPTLHDPPDGAVQLPVVVPVNLLRPSSAWIPVEFHPGWKPPLPPSGIS
jgi:hypothetical protein